MIDKIFGVDAAAILAFREVYEMLGGALPITAASVKTLFNQYNDYGLFDVKCQAYCGLRTIASPIVPADEIWLMDGDDCVGKIKGVVE